MKSPFFVRGKTLRIASTCLLVAAIGINILSTTSSAQATDDVPETEITLSPASARITLEKAKKYEGEIDILNSGSADFTAKVSAGAYVVRGNSYETTFQPSTDAEKYRTQLSRWVTFEQSSYLVPAGGKVTVPYTINVPTDVPDGGQYAVIFAETTGGGDQNASVMTNKRVGAVLYASVAGTTREGGDVTSSTISWWQREALLTATTTLKNTGNTDFVAISTVEISNILGGEKVFTSNEQDFVVLPDTERDIIAEWPNATTGIYRVEHRVLYLGKTYVKQQIVLFASPLLIIASCFILFGIVGWIVVIIRIHRKNKGKKVAKWQ